MQVERKKLTRQQRRKQRRNKNKRRRVTTAEQLLSKPSTDEFQVARWVKSYFEMSKGTHLNTEVEYFSSCSLIDRLLETGFAKGYCALFTTRDEAEDFLHLMLVHGFFLRVIKSEVRGPRDPKNKNDYISTTLEFHPDQTFCDDPEDTYVWLYEPLFLGNWALLFLLLFSLASLLIVYYWPQDLKTNVRVNCLVGSTLFFMYMILTCLRLVTHYFVHWLSDGTVEFMILPNLTRTVPFFQSLWPLCHLKQVIQHRIIPLKPNYSLLNIVNFYNISVGTFISALVFLGLLCFYLYYKFYVFE